MNHVHHTSFFRVQFGLLCHNLFEIFTLKNISLCPGKYRILDLSKENKGREEKATMVVRKMQ